jgi:hypothetical protein
MKNKTQRSCRLKQRICFSSESISCDEKKKHTDHVVWITNFFSLFIIKKEKTKQNKTKGGKKESVIALFFFFFFFLVN